MERERGQAWRHAPAQRGQGSGWHAPAAGWLESVRLGAIGAALPAATATTLAHRMPILAGLSSASALRQAAELWQMTWEKPAAFWQGCLDAGPLPWDLWRIWAAFLWSGRSQPDLPLRLAASSLGAVRRGVTPGHRRVVGNARRLSRRGKPGAPRCST